MPLIPINRQSIATVVQRQAIRLSVWRQPFDGRWYASLWFPEDTPIVIGRKLTLGQTLLAGVRSDFVGDFRIKPLVEGDASYPGEKAFGEPDTPGATHSLNFFIEDGASP